MEPPLVFPISDPTGAVTIEDSAGAQPVSDAVLDLPFLGHLPARRRPLSCKLSYNEGATRAEWKFDSYWVNGRLTALEYTRPGMLPPEKDLAKVEEGYRGHYQELLASGSIGAELPIAINYLFHFAMVADVDYLFIFAARLRENHVLEYDPSASKTRDVIIVVIFAKNVLLGGASTDPGDAARYIYDHKGNLLSLDSLTYGF